ncbi:hypothetical protein Nwi_1570 [Nitrobacter winogradskyi Nb-255]|uniref:Uncharacterized protein n=1 Tax=Nitrobacter winogradskyi (strain ATCC 25391 / DSM 10237 / CIP 104748 / NCIMB 11846 / Nb-255) TaxID=323098 RepID=Q3SSB0_NITWN|nr:hypothetical protein Nwi_1570 [Nitrobacter winogradskyi Nb-255]
MKKTRPIKIIEPASDFIRSGKALKIKIGLLHPPVEAADGGMMSASEPWHQEPWHQERWASGARKAGSKLAQMGMRGVESKTASRLKVRK